MATVKKPQGRPHVQKPIWRVVVDERTKIKTLDLFGTKDGMVEPTCKLFQKWKNEDKPVKFIRMDNADKNKTLQK